MTQQIVVLIDPEPLNRQASGRILRAAGFNVVEAESAQQACSMQPAVAVFSLRLPDFSGLFERWKNDPVTATIPCLLLGQPDLPGDFPTQDTDGYLAEPYTDTELSTYVKVLLRLAEYRRADTRIAPPKQELQTEEKLRESEERFRLFMENSPTIAWIKDDQGRHVYLSRTLEQRFGVSQADCLGKTDDELFPPDIAAEFRKNDLAVLAENRPLTVVELTRNADGSSCYWFNTKFPFRDSAGRRYVAGIGLDITERKQAEQALRQKSEEIERLLEVVPAAIWASYDPACRTITGNRRANELYEAASGENVSATTVPKIRRFFTPDGRELAPEELPMQLAAATNQAVQNVEIEVKLESGRTLFMLGSAVPLRDERGEVRGAISSFQDITARKQAEAALFASNQRLKALMNALPVGVSFSDDATCRHISGNPAVLAQFEIAPNANLSASALEADAAGRKVSFFLDDAPISDLDLPLQRAVAENREIAPMELEVRLPSGRCWYASASGAPIHDQDGRVAGGVAVTVDITKRKRAELALRESEEHLRLALEAGHMATWDWRIDSGEVVWNDEHYRMLGYEPGSVEPSYASWANRLHPEDRAATEEQLRWSMEEGSDYAAEFRAVWPNGTIHWIEARGRFDRDTNGRALRNNGVMIDITMRKQADEALQESEARLRLATEAAKIAAFDWNIQSGLNTWTPELEAMYGLAPGEFGRTQTSWVQLIHPGDRADALAKVEETLASGEPVEHEWRTVWPDGSTHWIAGRFQCFKDANAKPSHLRGVNIDITERKQSELALRRQAQLIELSFDPIFVWDMETGIVEWNRGCEELYGYARPEVLGRSSHDLLKTQHPIPYAKFEAQLLTSSSWSGELYHTTKGGRQIIVESRHQLLELDGRRLVLEINRDITERKQTEESLRRSEARYRLLHEGMRDAYVEVFMDGRIRDCNEVYCQLVGYTRPELQTMTYVDLTPRCWHAMEAAVVETQILPHGYSEVYEKEYRRKDGTLVPIELRTILVRDANGHPESMWATIRDISERKKSDAALRDSELRYRSLADATSAATWRCSPSGLFSEPQPEWMSFTGQTEEECLGDGWIKAIHPDDLAMLMSKWRDTVACAGLYATEYRVRRHDGQWRWINVQAAPVRDAGGKIVEWFGMDFDITERKQAELDLRESRRQLVMALEAGQLGFWDWDIPSGRVRFGGCWAAMLGYDDSEIEPHAHFWEKLVHPDEKESVVSTLSNHLAGRTEFYECEHRMRHKNGSWRWILDRGQVVERDAEARPLRAIGTHSDVTARHEAEVALQEADRRKDEFLATLAHELRNPLAPISNGLHILQRPGIDGVTVDKIHKMMDRQIKHMVRLVDDLMEVSRITRGKIELRKERIDLAEVLQSAIETSRPVINAARHRLDVELSAEPLFLDADKVRLTQVIANLLNNAAKYTHEGGRIWLSTRRDESNALISVRDNGMGIPADMLPKVFDLFTQVGRTYHRSQGGLGIGLTLVRHLVALHGGSVEANSEGVGKGSEFAVRLPAIESARPRDGGKEGEQAETIATRRILVVDDNPDIADSLAMLLKQLGAEVAIANGGPSALETLPIFRPSVVLLDIGMPGMDGFEVARHIRQQPGGRDIALIALTGWGQEQDRRQSRDAGIDHHLVKPVDLELLKELLA